QDGTAMMPPVQESGAEGEQSTADGQAYLGRESASAPAHAQSEPTQSFAAGAFDAGALGDPQPLPQAPAAGDDVDETAQQTEAPQTGAARAGGPFVAPQTSAADAYDMGTGATDGTQPGDGAQPGYGAAPMDASVGEGAEAPAATGPYVI